LSTKNLIGASINMFASGSSRLPGEHILIVNEKSMCAYKIGKTIDRLGRFEGALKRKPALTHNYGNGWLLSL